MKSLLPPLLKKFIQSNNEPQLQCYKTIVSRLEKKGYENRSVLKVNIFIYFKHQNAKFKLQVKILLLLEFSTISLSF